MDAEGNHANRRSYDRRSQERYGPHWAKPTEPLARRVWRWTGTWRATLCFLGIVTSCLAASPRMMMRMWPSDAPVASSGAPFCAPGTVVQRGGVLAVVAPETVAQTDTDIIGCAYYAYRNHRRPDTSTLGTRELHDVIITGSGIHPSSDSEIRALYLDYLASMNDPYWTKVSVGMRNGSAPATSFNSPRFAWMLGLLGGLAGFVRSLRWVAYGEERRPSRGSYEVTLDSEECLRCGYDLRGHRSGQCPRCGVRFDYT